MSRLMSFRWWRMPSTQRSKAGDRPRGDGSRLAAKRLRVEQLEGRAMMSAAGLAVAIGPVLPPSAGQNVAAIPAGGELAFPVQVAAAVRAGIPTDAYEIDDTWQQAQPIGVNAGPQTHSIHVTGDVDWATFQLATTSDVVIETRGRSGDTQMWLYGPDPDAAPIEFDNNDGVGNYSVIVRGGDQALAAGTYYVKVDENGHNGFIPKYTLSVTALQEGDVLVTQGKDGLSAAIRAGEASQLRVAFSNTFSHSAIYIGNGQVAEMLAGGFAVTSLAERYAESQRVDVLRDRDIGDKGAAVVDAVMKYVDTPYAFRQISVFATAAVLPKWPHLVAASPTYASYKRVDAGAKRMICSELVARAFDDASLPISVKQWPTLNRVGGHDKNFRMDFTSPTMLALSRDLQRLNA